MEVDTDLLGIQLPCACMQALVDTADLGYSRAMSAPGSQGATPNGLRARLTTALDAEPSSVPFVRTAKILAGVVVVLASLRLVYKAIGAGPALRPWTLIFVVLFAGAVGLAALLTARPRVARRWSNALLGAAVLTLAVLTLGTYADDYLPWLKTWINLGTVDAPAGIPTWFPLAMGSALVAAFWLAGRNERRAVTASAALYVALSGITMGLLLQLTHPNGLAVEEYFQTTSTAMTMSVLLVLATITAAILVRPKQPPLGPLVATKMWPIAAFAMIVLVSSAIIAQLGFRMALGSGRTLDAAITTSFVVQSVTLIGLLGFSVWFATVQQERARSHAVAQASAIAFSKAAYNSAVPTLLVNRDGTVVNANPSAAQLEVGHPEGLTGRNWCSIIDCWDSQDPTADDPLPAWWGDVLAGTTVHTERVRLTVSGGSSRWADLTAAAAADGTDAVARYVVVQLVDVTDSVSAHEELSFRTSHDALTGLLNRAEVTRLIDDSIDRGEGVLVAIVGVDRFGEINEAFGHSVGDQLLCTLAENLQSSISPEATVGRLDGDEFAVLMPLRIVDSAGAQRQLADLALAGVERDFVVGGYVLRPSASIGLTQSREGLGATELLRRASAALAAAKRAGGHRWHVYDHAFHARARDQLLVLEQLRAIDLADGQMQTWFQPIVDLSDFSTVGYEALLRWHHPDRGLTPAAEWIPAVESDVHLMHQLTLFAARESANFAATLPAGQRVCLNISARHLSSREFPEFVELLVDLRRQTPDPMILELTETALASMQGPARARLAQLVGVGYGLWGDDFGTGFSSVTHLRDLPLTGIKLDKSFTADLTDPQSSSFRIADGLAGLAEGLGLETVAEGVETPTQANRVAAAGWHLGQGWLFGRPNPIEHYNAAAKTED